MVNQNSKVKIIRIISLVLIIVVAIYFIFNHIDNDEDLVFIETINNKAISANILIINETNESNSVSYSAGQSGVIFKKVVGKYYVLTALHGIPLSSESSNTEFIVLGYNQPTYNESESGIGLAAYYSKFPRAVLEYYDEAYDLAVISFSSESEYAELSIASELPKYNEPVAAIGNPHGHSRNSITTGRIISKDAVPFGDEAGKNQFNVIEHSAKTYQGNSGGALINKNLEVVGINLGATENIFHQFKKGKAMPCDKMLDFLYDMERKLR